jgi:hypothetical protein
VERPPEARGDTRVMSESAARTLLTIMQGVTEDGTAKAAAIPGYAVAGKTGTAQKVTNGRYDSSKFLSSFVGIVPADNPRLVVAVMIDEPQGIHYGGVVAAPAFKAIAEGALRYLGVAPSSPVVADRKDKKPVKPEPKPARWRPSPTAPDSTSQPPWWRASRAMPTTARWPRTTRLPSTATEQRAGGVPRFHRHEHGRGHPGRAQGRRRIGSLGQRRGGQPVAQAGSGFGGHGVPGFLPAQGRLEDSMARLSDLLKNVDGARIVAGMDALEVGEVRDDSRRVRRAISSWPSRAPSKTDASSSTTPWPRGAAAILP